MKHQLKITKHLFDLLFQIRIKMKDVIDAAESEIPLTPTQLVILRHLNEHDTLAQGDLVRLMKRDKSQITRLVHDLVKKTLVIKTRDPEDGRRFILNASQDVRIKMAVFSKREDSIVTEMLADISKSHVKILEKVLIQMKENLEV